jgi:hypothetical protein
MADGQHKLSRRALLGAVCAAPVLAPVIPAQAGTPARPARSPSPWDSGLRRDDEPAPSSAVANWDRALARFAAAEAALAAAAGAPDHVYDPIGARHHAALALKLDLALDERTVAFNGDSAAMKMLKQDVHRLAASGA